MTPHVWKALNSTINATPSNKIFRNFASRQLETWWRVTTASRSSYSSPLSRLCVPGMINPSLRASHEAYDKIENTHQKRQKKESACNVCYDVSEIRAKIHRPNQPHSAHFRSVTDLWCDASTIKLMSACKIHWKSTTGHRILRGRCEQRSHCNTTEPLQNENYLRVQFQTARSDDPMNSGR